MNAVVLCVVVLAGLAAVEGGRRHGGYGYGSGYGYRNYGYGGYRGGLGGGWNGGYLNNWYGNDDDWYGGYR